jgi:ribonuclease J
MAHGDHKFVDVQEGDLVLLSSRTIPGNERSISQIINQLYRRGAEVLYEEVSEIHVSGHACQEEQKIMLQLVKPKYFVPVHGEYRHLLQHARLAETVGIPEESIYLLENGERLTVGEDGCDIQEATLGGTILIDGREFADVGEVVMRDRKHLSEDGIIVAIVTVDTKKCRVIGEPELVTKGFKENIAPDLLEDAKRVIRGPSRLDEGQGAGLEHGQGDFAPQSAQVLRGKSARRPMCCRHHGDLTGCLSLSRRPSGSSRPPLRREGPLPAFFYVHPTAVQDERFGYLLPLKIVILDRLKHKTRTRPLTLDRF